MTWRNGTVCEELLSGLKKWRKCFSPRGLVGTANGPGWNLGMVWRVCRLEKVAERTWGYVLRQNLVMWCLKRFQTQAQRSNQEIGHGPKDMMSKPVPQPRPEVWKKRTFDYTVGVVMSSGLFLFSGSHEARCLHNWLTVPAHSSDEELHNCRPGWMDQMGEA